MRLCFTGPDFDAQRRQFDGLTRNPDLEVERARRLHVECLRVFAVSDVAEDQLQAPCRNPGDFEPPFRVGDHAETGAEDRDHRTGDRRARVRVDDDAGDGPRLLGAEGHRNREGDGDEEESAGAANTWRSHGKPGSRVERQATVTE